MRRRFASIAVALVATSLGCGVSGGPEFATKYAPNVRREGLSVSVFGVYKDGRMNAEAWADLAPRFASALGSASCGALHTDALLAADHDVATALDDTTRSDGVSEELLEVFAPAAAGETIMVVTIAGRPPGPTILVSEPRQQPYVSPGRNNRAVPGSGMGRTEPVSGGPSRHHDSHDVFEVSATLFSVHEHHNVALVTMSYTGKSADEAIAAFSAKLRTELPGMRCEGWKPDVKVDAERVRTAR